LYFKFQNAKFDALKLNRNFKKYSDFDFKISKYKNDLLNLSFYTLTIFRALFAKISLK